MRLKPLFILTILLVLGAGFVQALEINYPVVPGAEAPQVFMPKIASGIYPKEAALALMIRYLYVLAIFSASSICILAMVYGGVIYFFSGGNPGKIMVAKDQIVSAFFGALLLATSFMSLKLLDPDLVILSQSPITHPTNSYASFSPPAERLESYWELPMGRIEAGALEKAKMMEAPSAAVKNSSGVLKQKAQELKNLINQCRCSRLDSICSASTCAVINPCSGIYETLCPNSNLIAAKKAEVLAAATDLQNKTNVLRTATIALFTESSKLQAAKRIMENCEGEAVDLYSYQSVKEVFKTETKYIWSIPGSGSDPRLDCDQSAPEVALPNTLDKPATYHLALIWHALGAGNRVMECYNDTVRKSLSAGINPAFALAIWLNESNASNYSLSVEDFGIHSASVVGFTAQITRFLALPEIYRNTFPQCFGRGHDMEDFLRIFRSGNCTDQAGLDYVNNIRKGAWTFMTSCPFPSYPTDTTCY